MRYRLMLLCVVLFVATSVAHAAGDFDPPEIAVTPAAQYRHFSDTFELTFYGADCDRRDGPPCPCDAWDTMTFRGWEPPDPWLPDQQPELQDDQWYYTVYTADFTSPQAHTYTISATDDAATGVDDPAATCTGCNVADVCKKVIVAAIDMDIDTDSNNDGTINESDDPVEQVAPGRVVALNDDDDNENDVEDIEDGEVTGEDDLAEVRLSYLPQNATELTGCSVELIFSDVVGVFQNSTKTNPVASGVPFVIGTSQVPTTVYVEGRQTGGDVLTWKFRAPDGTEVWYDKVLITVVDAVVSTPSAATPVLISKGTSTGDSYPSTYQTENRRVRITASIGSAIPNVKVYFNSWDIDDKSPYETNTPEEIDNNDGTGAFVLAPNYDGLPGAPGYALTDGNGVAKMDLEITDHAAGDNYVVTVHPLRVSPTRLNDCSGNMVAWKRVYVEMDKMLKTGSDLQTDFLPDANDLPDSLALVDAGWCAVGQLVLVFDADNPEGESATITSVNGSSVTLNIDLQHAYNAGYSTSDRGAALGLPSDGFLEPGFSRLTAAYGDPADTEGTDGGAFIEFKALTPGSSLVPSKGLLSPNSQPSIGAYRNIWFEHKGTDNYFYFLGAKHYGAPFDGMCGTSSPSLNHCIIYISEISLHYQTALDVAISDITAHEAGHQFVPVIGTDKSHAVGIWCHEGPNTDYCLMSYQRGREDGRTEFCMDGGNHLGDARTVTDPQ